MGRKLTVSPSSLWGAPKPVVPRRWIVNFTNESSLVSEARSMAGEHPPFLCDFLSFWIIFGRIGCYFRHWCEPPLTPPLLLTTPNGLKVENNSIKSDHAPHSGWGKYSTR
jgi:hypothetical protein